MGSLKTVALHAASATHAARAVAHCTEHSGAGARMSTHASVNVELHGLLRHVCSTEGAGVGAAEDGASVGAGEGAVGATVVVCGNVGELVELSAQRLPCQPSQQVQFTPTSVEVVQGLG